MKTIPIYKLAGQKLLSQGRFELKIIRLVDDQELARFEAATYGVSALVKSYALYGMCADNLQELMVSCERIRGEFLSVPQMDEARSWMILNEVNRRLMNYLSSWKALFDHYKTRYTKLDRTGVRYLDKFLSYDTKIRSESFEYRFFNNLRNYVQHCGLPIENIEAGAHINDAGKVEANLAIYFLRDDLLTKYKDWKDVKAELLVQPEKMEIGDYLASFEVEVRRFFEYCMGFELEIVSNSRRYLESIVAEVRSQLPEGNPLIVDTSDLSRIGGNLQSRIVPYGALEIIQSLEITLQHAE